MIVYALIHEAHSDDDRLLGVYSSLQEAERAYAVWGYGSFYRIEARELDAAATERHPDQTIYETGAGDE
jgi:hypothetical protein